MPTYAIDGWANVTTGEEAPPHADAEGLALSEALESTEHRLRSPRRARG